MSEFALNKSEMACTEIKSSDLSNIKLKRNVKLNKFKVLMIELNNIENVNYKDARQCMNIGLIGAENIENNNNFRVLTKEEIVNLNRRIKYNISDKLQTIRYSSNSSLAKSAKQSEKFKSAVKSWINTPEEYRPKKILLEMNDSENLSRSILHATILNPQVSNGYFTGYLYDVYDFRSQMLETFYKTIANAGAVALQTVGQLKNYNIIIPVKIKL